MSEQMQCHCKCGGQVNDSALDTSGREVYQCRYCGVLRRPWQCPYCGDLYLIEAGTRELECSCGKMWQVTIDSISLAGTLRRLHWALGGW
jgi:hypothetical protein